MHKVDKNFKEITGGKAINNQKTGKFNPKDLIFVGVMGAFLLWVGVSKGIIHPRAEIKRLESGLERVEVYFNKTDIAAQAKIKEIREGALRHNFTKTIADLNPIEESYRDAVASAPSADEINARIGAAQRFVEISDEIIAGRSEEVFAQNYDVYIALNRGENDFSELMKSDADNKKEEKAKVLTEEEKKLFWVKGLDSKVARLRVKKAKLVLANVKRFNEDMTPVEIEGTKLLAIFDGKNRPYRRKAQVKALAKEWRITNINHNNAVAALNALYYTKMKFINEADAKQAIRDKASVEKLMKSEELSREAAIAAILGEASKQTEETADLESQAVQKRMTAAMDDKRKYRSYSDRSYAKRLRQQYQAEALQENISVSALIRRRTEAKREAILSLSQNRIKARQEGLKRIYGDGVNAERIESSLNDAAQERAAASRAKAVERAQKTAQEAQERTVEKQAVKPKPVVTRPKSRPKPRPAQVPVTQTPVYRNIPAPVQTVPVQPRKSAEQLRREEEARKEAIRQEKIRKAKSLLE